MLTCSRCRRTETTCMELSLDGLVNTVIKAPPWKMSPAYVGCHESSPLTAGCVRRFLEFVHNHRRRDLWNSLCMISNVAVHAGLYVELLVL